ncbi:MAG: PspC domain-containing protein [Streptosporangiales bacterium]|nr:PspC domain-containing protein [Streptosporangiales bacterium]
MQPEVRGEPRADAERDPALGTPPQRRPGRARLRHARALDHRAPLRSIPPYGQIVTRGWARWHQGLPWARSGIAPETGPPREVRDGSGVSPMGRTVQDRQDGAMTEGTPETTGTAPPDADGQHRLRRDRERKMLLGVCAGLGRYTGIDPVVFRLVFVILLITGGSGALLYLAAWLMIPDEAGGPSAAEQALHRRLDDDVVITLLGLGLGLAALLSLAFGGFGQGTLVIVTVLTLSLLIAHGRGADVPQAIRRLPQRLRRREPPPPPPPPPPKAGPPPAYGDGPVDLALLGPPRPAPPGPDPAGRGPFVPGSDPAGPAGASGAPAAPPWAPVVEWHLRRRDRPRSTITLLVIFLIAVEAGAFWLVYDNGYVPGLEQRLLASALITIGLGLVLAAFLGRGRGLVVLGTIASVALTGTTTQELTPNRFGAVVWRPAAAAEIDGPYRLTAGTATLDLTGLRLDSGQSVQVRATVRFGRLEVRVPQGSEVTVHGSAGVGDVQVGDHVQGGVRVRIDRVLEPDRALPRKAPRIELDVQTTLGDLEVRRVPA